MNSLFTREHFENLVPQKCAAVRHHQVRAGKASADLPIAAAATRGRKPNLDRPGSTLVINLVVEAAQVDADEIMKEVNDLEIRLREFCFPVNDEAELVRGLCDAKLVWT